MFFVWYDACIEFWGFFFQYLDELPEFKSQEIAPKTNKQKRLDFWLILKTESLELLGPHSLMAIIDSPFNYSPHHSLLSPQHWAQLPFNITPALLLSLKLRGKENMFCTHISIRRRKIKTRLWTIIRSRQPSFMVAQCLTATWYFELCLTSRENYFSYALL